MYSCRGSDGGSKGVRIEYIRWVGFGMSVSSGEDYKVEDCCCHARTLYVIVHTEKNTIADPA